MRSVLLGLSLIGALMASLLTLACGDDAGPDPTPVPGAALEGRITVFAAVSLADAFNEIAAEFKVLNPRVDFEFNFQGSPTLRTQLEQGARADIYASADLNQMNLARQAGVLTGESPVFVRNSLVVITPASNPGRIASLADLRRDGLKLVLANAEVPVGAYSRQMLTAASNDPAYGAGFSDAVLENAVSLESNVRQVVAKVELGEADAGIVYGSDVTPAVAPKLSTVAVPAAFNVVAEYPIALVKDGSNPRAAQAFIDYVLSAAGQAVLRKHGFA
jgi:molybdate transport system substrate-binding protein